MISRIGIPIALTAFVTIVSLSPAQAQAPIVYATGFEAPAFSTTAVGTFPNVYTGTPFTTVPGALAASPADQWGLGWDDIPGNIPQSAINYENCVNSATVQTSVVRSGAQALKVDGTVANQKVFTAFKGLPLSTVNTVYDFNFDMQVSGASAQAGQWGLTVVDENSARIASLGFYQGILVAGSGTSLYGLGPFTPIGYDNWATYKLSVNFFTKTMSVALNGFPISSMQNLPLRNDITFTSTLAGVGLGGQAPDGAPYTTTPERAYFDSFSVTSAPEPGTLAFLALGGTLVVTRRRSVKKEG
jgi:hypothetical protein